jgi:ATP/maltotriose-dependent transcriptional regulator MalT
MATTTLPPPGPLRARALLDATERTDDVLGSLHLFARALDQPGLTADLRAEIHVLRAQFESAGLGRIDDAIGSFDAAANARPSAGLLGCALAGAAYYRFRAGEPLDLPTFERAIALSQESSDPRIRVFAREMRALATGTYDLERARELLELELRKPDTIGNEFEFVEVTHHLCTLELHAGRLAAARRHLESAESYAWRPDMRARHLGLRTALAAALGDEANAHHYAALAEPALSESGDVVALTHVRMAMATLELSLGNPAGAWQALERSAQTTGAGQHFLLVRVLPYAIEALVELGQLEEAAALADGLEAADDILARWRGPALRARALVQAPTDRDSALALFDAALAADEHLGSGFETARTLFARGRVLRRWKRRRAARDSLDSALTRFETMGARLWAVRVAQELERTATRRVVNGELTPSDAQIARLAASGRTNREIAQTLFVSPKTVEAALSRVYGTLGVRSRAELAALRISF